MDTLLSKFQGIVKGRNPGMLQSIGSQRAGHGLATEQQQEIIQFNTLMSHKDKT